MTYYKGIIMNNDLDNMIVYAARYAHARQTGAALQVVSCAIKNWDKLSARIQEQLVREASNEATYNHNDWQRLIQFSQKNVKTKD